MISAIPAPNITSNRAIRAKIIKFGDTLVYLQMQRASMLLRSIAIKIMKHPKCGYYACILMGRAEYPYLLIWKSVLYAKLTIPIVKWAVKKDCSVSNKKNVPATL